MICIAEKKRLPLRGLRDGHRYLVKKETGGWWVEPAPVAARARRSKPSVSDLSAHLDALAAEGFSFEPAKKENVPPCRF